MNYPAIWAFPWSLIDEGVERSLEAIRTAGIRAVHVTTSYHSVQALLPQNPRRKVFTAGAAVYFRPDPTRYPERLQPVVSPLVEEEGDLLTGVIEGCRSLDLPVVGWTVCLHNSQLGLLRPDLTLENAFGDRYPHVLCPGQPEVQAYLTGLVADLVARDLDAIELEAANWLPVPHHAHWKGGIAFGPEETVLLSFCFCPACRDQARAEGIDADAAATRIRDILAKRWSNGAPPGGNVAALLAAEPELAAYAQMRAGIVTRLIAAARQAAGRRLIFREQPGPAAARGVDLPAIARIAEEISIHIQGPSLQREIGRLDQTLRLVPEPERILVGPNVAHPDARGEELVAAAQLLRDRGCRMGFYAFGLLTPQREKWVRNAAAGCAG